MIKPKHIVFTGPESSGKTTWSKWFAKQCNFAWNIEYAREFLNKNGTSYNYSDLLTIAKGQLAINKNHLNSISDTDLLTILIWSEVKYNKVDDWIVHQLNKNLPDYYILCKPDIEWEFDELRENENNRDELFRIYLEKIEALGIPYLVLKGDKYNRKQMLNNFKRSFFDTEN